MEEIFIILTAAISASTLLVTCLYYIFRVIIDLLGFKLQRQVGVTIPFRLFIFVILLCQWYFNGGNKIMGVKELVIKFYSGLGQGDRRSKVQGFVLFKF